MKVNSAPNHASVPAALRFRSTLTGKDKAIILDRDARQRKLKKQTRGYPIPIYPSSSIALQIRQAESSLRVSYKNPLYLKENQIQDITRVIQKHCGSDLSLFFTYCSTKNGHARFNQAEEQNLRMKWLVEEVEKGLSGKANEVIENYQLISQLHRLSYIFEARFLFPAVFLSELLPKLYKKTAPAIVKPPIGGVIAASSMGFGIALQWLIENRFVNKKFFPQIEGAVKQLGIKLASNNREEFKNIFLKNGWYHPSWSPLVWNTLDKTLILSLLGYVNIASTQLTLAVMEASGLEENINTTDLPDIHLLNINTTTTLKVVDNSLNIFLRLCLGRVIALADMQLTPQPLGTSLVNGIGFASLLGAEQINNYIFLPSPSETGKDSSRYFLLQALISATCISLAVTTFKPAVMAVCRDLDQQLRYWFRAFTTPSFLRK